MKTLTTHLGGIDKGSSFQCFVKKKRPWKLQKILCYFFNAKKEGNKRKSPSLYNDSLSSSQSSQERSKSIQSGSFWREPSLNTQRAQITWISKHLTCSLVVLRFFTKEQNLRPETEFPGGPLNIPLLYLCWKLEGKINLPRSVQHNPHELSKKIFEF